MMCQVKSQGCPWGFICPTRVLTWVQRKEIMLTRFMIDVFFTGCIIGMPAAVWCVWKFGPVKVMRYLELHSDEDLADKQ